MNLREKLSKEGNELMDCYFREPCRWPSPLVVRAEAIRLLVVKAYWHNLSDAELLMEYLNL